MVVNMSAKSIDQSLSVSNYSHLNMAWLAQCINFKAERERERERDRQTDRQTERQRETDRQTDGRTERERERERKKK